MNNKETNRILAAVEAAVDQHGRDYSFILFISDVFIHNADNPNARLSLIFTKGGVALKCRGFNGLDDFEFAHDDFTVTMGEFIRWFKESTPDPMTGLN